MAAILETKGIEKSYSSPHGKLHVLRGIDMRLEQGEMMFITGRSGSGKSTLLHLLGLLDTCDKGQLFFAGENVTKLNDRKTCKLRNGSIGFLFQFYNLLPELTVLENVTLPGLIGKRKKVTQRAKELLEQVELVERMKHFPHQLSGGEQQRVGLVRALINEPALVLCDEPTGNLDEESSEMVMRLIRRLNKERKQTFCIVTHDEIIAREGNSKLHLRSGVLHSPAA
ncbi:MAG: ABC transporter ATP-binding protein [Candidatus Omnitrophica bacterium]|nr:ABC transporter ATP-binding protein [Candidatus Omnitrophota bacterium]